MPNGIDIPKLAFPLRFEGGRARVVEQDSVEEIEDCVEVAVRTTRGDRMERPDYGMPDLLFEEVHPGGAAAEILEAILEAEPRAAVAVTEDESELNALTRSIQIRQEQDNG